jgi:hypothetical protein
VHLYEQETNIRIVSVSLCDDNSAVSMISFDGLCIYHSAYLVDNKQIDIS